MSKTTVMLDGGEFIHTTTTKTDLESKTSIKFELKKIWLLSVLVKKVAHTLHGRSFRLESAFSHAIHRPLPPTCLPGQLLFVLCMM